MAAVLVVEGDATDLERGTLRMRLVAVLLKVTPRTAQLAYADQRAVLHLVTLPLAPKAFVA